MQVLGLCLCTNICMSTKNFWLNSLELLGTWTDLHDSAGLGLGPGFCCCGFMTYSDTWFCWLIGYFLLQITWALLRLTDHLYKRPNQLHCAEDMRSPSLLLILLQLCCLQTLLVSIPTCKLPGKWVETTVHLLHDLVGCKTRQLCRLWGVRSKTMGAGLCGLVMIDFYHKQAIHTKYTHWHTIPSMF